MKADDTSPNLTEKNGSMVLFILSLLSLSLTLLVGFYLVTAIVKHKTDPAFAGESISQAEGMVFFAAIGLGLLTLLFSFLPALLLHSRKNRRRDQMSLRLSGLSLVLLSLELLVVLFGWSH